MFTLLVFLNGFFQMITDDNYDLLMEMVKGSEFFICDKTEYFRGYEICEKYKYQWLECGNFALYPPYVSVSGNVDYFTYREYRGNRVEKQEKFYDAVSAGLRFWEYAEYVQYFHE